MKFSETWLREWINPPINNVELIHQLTMIGFKVDESKPVSNIFYGIVIGKIIECKTYLNFNNMWVTKVNNGGEKLLNIVCCAINCRKNIKVVVANVGAILPNGNKITINTIQGHKSEGILCTFKTLGIVTHTQGIIELPEDAPIGQDFYSYLHLHDKIIDINVTPNRGDCLSIVGMAREIAIVNHLTLKNLNTHIIKPTINDTISVLIHTPNACPKYLIRIIKKINTTTPTPIWIQEKLRRCGIDSDNIVTDITNYVLIELGHPVYAFDYKQIEENTIQVRFTKIEETIKLSKNNILKLFPNTLVISDTKKILSLAGITISDQFYIYPHQANNIILQSAFFIPSIIAHQSKIYNINTLSSTRYARGVDPSISQLALERVTYLLLENCKSGDPGPITDITHNNWLPKPALITLHHSKLNKILGFYITYHKVTELLKQLGFQIIKLLKNNCWKILCPTWRFDLVIEENIIAEIVRIYGYDHIPNVTINTNLTISNNYASNVSLSKAKSLLIARGYQEIITYSFVNPNIQKLFFPKKNPLKLKNPMTIEMSSMRLSLWIGLIETMIYNQNRQQKNIKLFESGICFTPDIVNNNKTHQNFMIAGIRYGLRFDEHWDLTKNPTDFYDIKGDVEALLHLTNKFDSIIFKRSIHPALHPMQNAAIYLHNNMHIGYIGVIHPAIQTTLNIQSHVLVFELKWNLISHIKSPKIFEISKFPKNYRDISIIVSEKISFESIINVCKKINSNKLIDIQLSDVYKDSSIPKNCKSLTIKLCLQSNTHTLKEEEITDVINQCIKILKNNFYVILR